MIYHIIFANGYEKFHDFQKNLHAALSFSLWITEETKTELLNLNYLFTDIDKEFNLKQQSVAINAGKSCYEEVVRLRENIEKSYRKDMLQLHKVPTFLKMKRKVQF